MRILNLRFLGFILASVFVMVQYQNCAPAPSVDQEGIGSEAPPISTIDNVNLSTGLTFVEKSITVHDAIESFQVDGLCSKDQDGARFKWHLVDEQGEIKSGRAECHLGSFSVLVDESQALTCGQPHKIVAQLGLGKAAEVEVFRKCAPVEFKVIAENENEQCYFELSDDGQVACHEVCYDSGSGRVESKKQVALASCVN